MSRIRLDQDIRPLSEFRARTAELIDQVRESRRPLVLTQRGQSVAVILDVKEYEVLLEKIELLEDIRTAERQLAEGDGVDQDAARRRVMSGLDDR